jgi:glycosyltransferase involved in cell wall biosynthesis
MGHGVARRTGLEHCTHDFVAIADADDVNVPTRFEKQMTLFENDPQLDAVSSGCYHFADTINDVLYEETLPETDAEIKDFLKKRCPLCQASTMFRKSKVDEAGGYQDWYHAEDYYLWIRMFLCGATFQNTKESLLYVRSNPDYVNRRGGWKYFKSLARLFGYMYKHNVIGLGDYVFNVTSRFVAQVLLPNGMRGWLRKIVDKQK